MAAMRIQMSIQICQEIQEAPNTWLNNFNIRGIKVLRYRSHDN